MKKLILPSFPAAILLGAILLAGAPLPVSGESPSEPVLVHTVMFSLKTPVDSSETRQFLADGKRILTAIPGVENFEVRRQVSEKNDFQFGFSMSFADRASFESYLAHPLHEQFVKERWEKEVTSFLEADYVAWNPE